jgi:archaellum component FlaC
MPNALQEAGAKLQERSGELATLFKKRDPATGRQDWNEDHSKVQSLNTEVEDLTKDYEKLFALDQAEKKNNERMAKLAEPTRQVPYGAGNGSADAIEADRRQAALGGLMRKTIGEMAVESVEFKESGFGTGLGRGRPFTLEIANVDVSQGLGHAFGLKTVMTSAAGWAPFSPRIADVVPFAVRRPMVQDLMPSIPINVKSVVYMEETTRTPAATVVAENAQKPEAARQFTERTVNTEKIAVTLPVTDEQLDDVPQIRAYIDASLGTEVELAEETEILTGDGTSGVHLQGYLTKAGVQVQAKGADPVPSAILKAFTLVRFTGFAEPSGVILHPNDWQDIRLLQDTTGRYIWGDPSVVGPETLWGKPIVVTPAETEGIGLVGDFRTYAFIGRRMGVRVELGYNSTDFVFNRKTIKAESRLVLVIRRPGAFAKVTGI